MNRSLMMGRLVRNPEIRYVQGEDGELAVANFRLAVDRKYDKDKADFIKCAAFGRLAEFAEKYLLQGIKVVVSGELRNDNYTNQDGEKVYGMCLRLDDIEFAESKAASQRNGEEPDRSRNGNGSNRGKSQNRPASKGREGSAREGTSGGGSENRAGDRERPKGRRNESGNSRERGRRNDVDEEFKDIDECEDEDNYNFN